MREGSVVWDPSRISWRRWIEPMTGGERGRYSPGVVKGAASATLIACCTRTTARAIRGISPPEEGAATSNSARNAYVTFFFAGTLVEILGLANSPTYAGL